MEKVPIAYVEDDPLMTMLVAYNLDSLGYQTHCVDSGWHAVQAIETIMPKVAIIDWTLPQMSGIQVLRDLRRHPTLSDLPIIIVTARMEPNDSSFALACGANVFLRKPFSMAQLKATVEQLATGSEQNLAKTVQA